MGKLRWYKRDPNAALSGMMELSLEERGAYNTVLDLLYSRDGDLPDDERFIAGWLRVDVRVWKRIRTKLIERGKLYAEDGKIRNKRADVEVLAALSRVASAVDAGVASGISRAGKSDAKPTKINDLDGTPVATEPERNPELTTTTSTQTEESTPVGAQAPRKAKAVLWEEMKGQVGGNNPGSLIGKWLKQHGEGEVFAAHFAAMGNMPADYVEWMTKRLSANGKPYKVRSAGGDQRSYTERSMEQILGEVDDDGYQALLGHPGAAAIVCPGGTDSLN